MGFRVLYVCTANVCRSPMAELLMRERLDPHSDAAVASAGMSAHCGDGIDAPAAAAMAGRGIDASRHRARQFQPWMASRADLVLTAERAHRDRIITAAPATFRRVFTMTEFARLAGQAAGRPLGRTPGAVVATLAQQRGLAGPVDGDDDMPDAFRGSLARAADVAARIDDTVRQTVGVLGLGRPRSLRLVPPAAAPSMPVPDRGAGRAAVAVRRPRPSPR